MKISVEKFHQIMSYQTRIFVIRTYLAAFGKPMYTGSEYGDMIKNLKLEDRLSELYEKMNDFESELSDEEASALANLGDKLKSDPKIKEKYLYKNTQIEDDIKTELGFDMNMSEYLEFIQEYLD